MTKASQDVLDAMLAAVQNCLSTRKTPSKLWVLTDGALLRDAPARTRRHWRVDTAVSLLPLGTATSALKVGPLMFELSMAELDRGRTESLFDVVRGQMLGSFLVSKNPDGTALEVMREFVNVQLEDGTEMVMRFYDPRILPFWLRGLSDVYRKHVGTAVSHWVYSSEALQVEVTEFTSTSGHANTKAEFPLRLSAQREAALIDASTPYLVMSRLQSEKPDCLSRIAHHERYGFFRKQLERAGTHGLNNLPDLETYCALAVALGARFDCDPAMKTALLSMKSGTNFAQAISILGERDWQRMREARQ